ncbi:MAG: TetR/AcrR family transcriptional regulator [Pseudomonadota bacterium]
MRPSKRDQIIDSALSAFMAEGYQAMGMDALAVRCCVSKTTFYNHFSSKEALIVAALERRDQDFRAWFAARLEALRPDPERRLFAVFDVLAEWFRSDDFSGCAFIKAAAEHQAPGDQVRALAAAHKQALRADLEALALAADAAEPQGLATKLALLIDGATVAAQLDLEPDPAAEARAIAETLIQAAISGNVA